MPAPTLESITPMLLGEVKQPFDDPDWIFEIKHDGYRCLAEVRGHAARLRSRNGTNMTAWFPEVVRGLATVDGNHIFDGEIVVLDEYGDRTSTGCRTGRNAVAGCPDRIAWYSSRSTSWSTRARRSWGGRWSTGRQGCSG